MTIEKLIEKMIKLWHKRFEMEQEGKDTLEITSEINNIEYYLKGVI